MPPSSSFLWAVVGAWATFLVARHADLLALAKPTSQRTEAEITQVRTGLGRDLRLSAAVFVPLAACLLIVSTYGVAPFWLLDESFGGARAAGIGALSYEVPLGRVRRAILGLATSYGRERLGGGGNKADRNTNDSSRGGDVS